MYPNAPYSRCSELQVGALIVKIRKVSCGHSLPEGNLSVLVGRHSEMNPAGRVRSPPQLFAIRRGPMSQKLSVCQWVLNGVIHR
jgi:hypothetical protein